MASGRGWKLVVSLSSRSITTASLRATAVTARLRPSRLASASPQLRRAEGRCWQSGQTDRQGRISKRGDPLLSYLFEARRP